MVPKYKMTGKGKLYSLLNEPNILRNLNKSSFIPEILSSFQDYDNMYIVTTFYTGPTLMKFIHLKLSEDKIRFITACIILSLKYLREKQIIHRDLTFNNIIMDKDYYFNLIDFSFSVNYSKKNIKEFMCRGIKVLNPPEIINKSKYDYNSDYYTLGNLIFFLIFKNYPMDIKQPLNLTQLVHDYNFTDIYSIYLFDFLSKILESNILLRLGYKSIDELIKHPWLNKIDWKKLEYKQLISPFNNTKVGKYINNCEKFNKTKEYLDRYSKVCNTDYYKKFFKIFEYANNNGIQLLYI
jgi:serine/threonine protein kinase